MKGEGGSHRRWWIAADTSALKQHFVDKRCVSVPFDNNYADLSMNIQAFCRFEILCVADLEKTASGQLYGVLECEMQARREIVSSIRFLQDNAHSRCKVTLMEWLVKVHGKAEDVHSR